jgi:hypothetical protein
LEEILEIASRTQRRMEERKKKKKQMKKRRRRIRIRSRGIRRGRRIRRRR